MKQFTPTILWCLLFSGSLISCTWEKEHGEIDSEPLTIFPLNYYPIFPGSWWLYEVNDTITEQFEVSQTYLPYSYENTASESWESPTFSETVLVPFLNGKPVYGYNKIAWVRPPFGDYYIQWPILSEEVGFEFERDWTDKRYGDFSEKVKVTSKYFNGTDSIITLEGHWVYGPNVSHKSYQTFAKNIGLTFEVIVDTITTDTIYKKILSDYFINQ